MAVQRADDAGNVQLLQRQQKQQPAAACSEGEAAYWALSQPMGLEALDEVSMGPTPRAWGGAPSQQPHHAALQVACHGDADAATKAT
jgi:hypothetical protein